MGRCTSLPLTVTILRGTEVLIDTNMGKSKANFETMHTVKRRPRRLNEETCRERPQDAANPGEDTEQDDGVGRVSDADCYRRSLFDIRSMVCIVSSITPFHSFCSSCSPSPVKLYTSISVVPNVIENFVLHNSSPYDMSIKHQP